MLNAANPAFEHIAVPEPDTTLTHLPHDSFQSSPVRQLGIVNSGAAAARVCNYVINFRLRHCMAPTSTDRQARCVELSAVFGALIRARSHSAVGLTLDSLKCKRLHTESQ